MALNGSDDMQMDVEGSGVDVAPPKIAQETISPRVFIEPTEKFTFRPFPDGKKPKVALNWATEKESEVTAKEKKARRKEKQKEKKSTGPMEPEEAAAAAPLDPIAPQVPEKISKTETKKRKSEAVAEAANKRKVPAPPDDVQPPKANPPPPKRKEMTKDQRTAQNKQKREAKKTKKKVQTKAAVEQPVSKEDGDEGKTRVLGSQYDSIYQDGLTVWVNHPTLSSEGNDLVYVLVGRKIKEVAQAAHPHSIIEFTNVNRAGWHATVIRTGSEAIRKLVTDNRLSAKLEFKNVMHHLQIQPYKGGGNTYFTIAPLGPFSGNPSLVVQAIERVYNTKDFGCWQYYDAEGDFKHDILLVRFNEAPRESVKELSLHPDQPDGGYKVRMVPYAISGRCRNPSCAKEIHSRMCKETKVVREFPIVESAPTIFTAMEE